MWRRWGNSWNQLRAIFSSGFSSLSSWMSAGFAPTSVARCCFRFSRLPLALCPNPSSGRCNNYYDFPFKSNFSMHTHTHTRTRTHTHTSSCNHTKLHVIHQDKCWDIGTLINTVTHTDKHRPKTNTITDEHEHTHIHMNTKHKNHRYTHTTHTRASAYAHTSAFKRGSHLPPIHSVHIHSRPSPPPTSSGDVCSNVLFMFANYPVKRVSDGVAFRVQVSVRRETLFVLN